MKPLGGNREGASKRQRGSGGFSRDAGGDFAGLLALFPLGAFARVGVRKTDPFSGPLRGFGGGPGPCRLLVAPPRCTSPAASTGTPRPDGWEGLRVRRGSRPPPAPCARHPFRGGLAAFPTLPRNFRGGGPQPYPSAKLESNANTVFLLGGPAASPLGRHAPEPRVRDDGSRGTARVAGFCEPAVFQQRPRVGGEVERLPSRPVLKHGPRSLTCTRVVGPGFQATPRRSESERSVSPFRSGRDRGVLFS